MRGLRAGQHPLHRGEAPGGVLGILRATAGRRAEAHLWLLLEEALVAVGRGAVDPWEVERAFRYVAAALAAIAVLPADLADAMRRELTDALVVRGVVPPAGFTAEPFPGRTGDDETTGHGQSAAVWLEAEIERHLDLLASYDPNVDPQAGADTMRILGGPVRAFDAAGVLGPAEAMLADLATSMAAAGFEPGRPVGFEGRVRREWVRFLRDRPGPLPVGHEADHERACRVELGQLRGRTVRVDEVRWSADAVLVRVALRPTDPLGARSEDAGRSGSLGARLGFGVAAEGGAGGRDGAPWMARAVDDRGRIHLGQPAARITDGGTAALFALRPGLGAGAKRIDVRVTTGGQRVEGTVPL